MGIIFLYSLYHIPLFPFSFIVFFCKVHRWSYGTSVFFSFFFPSCLLMVDGWMDGRREGGIP